MSRIDALEILLAAVKDGALDGCELTKKDLLTSIGHADKASADILALLQHRPALH
jgi:hypothetical protein